jgi:uncharacterized membrane protein YphA (DoxX/SURF4 family)
MHREELRARLNRIDARITGWMAEYGVKILRVALGVVFFWYGALKLVPGLSPAAELVRDTVPFLPGDLFVPFLGVWEMVIGLGFITGWALRIVILLLFLQMLGAMSPIFVLPDRVFTIFPFGLTLEGQYIFKNLVLIAAALVIGSTVHGGHLGEKLTGRS